MPQVPVSAPVLALTNTASVSSPSTPSQFWSMSSPAASGAPGKIESSPSSQSAGGKNPSPSPSPVTVIVTDEVPVAPSSSVTVRVAV